MITESSSSGMASMLGDCEDFTFPPQSQHHPHKIPLDPAQQGCPRRTGQNLFNFREQGRGLETDVFGAAEIIWTNKITQGQLLCLFCRGFVRGSPLCIGKILSSMVYWSHRFYGRQNSEEFYRFGAGPQGPQLPSWHHLSLIWCGKHVHQNSSRLDYWHQDANIHENITDDIQHLIKLCLKDNISFFKGRNHFLLISTNQFPF